MFKALLRSLITPQVIRGLIRRGIMLVGGAIGYQAMMHGQDVDAVASAVFVIGSTVWGWYDDHQHAKKSVMLSQWDDQIEPLPPIVLGRPSEEQITAQLNRAQLNH